MSDKELRAELAFQATMTAARKLLDAGAVTEEEYRSFEAEMIEKYSPFFGQLLSEKHLL